MIRYNFIAHLRRCRCEIAFAVLLTVLTLITNLPVAADEVHIGHLKISEAWARPTPQAAKVGGGYLVIENSGPNDDRLIAGKTDIAGHVQIHEMSMEGDVMKMRALANGLQIRAKKTVVLKPGSFHLMFMSLKQPLVLGQNFMVQLRFERAGAVAVKFNVAQHPGPGPGTDKESHSGHTSQH